MNFTSIQICIVFTLSLFKKKGKGSFYIAQYPFRWTAQSNPLSKRYINQNRLSQVI